MAKPIMRFKDADLSDNDGGLTGKSRISTGLSSVIHLGWALNVALKYQQQL